MDEVAPGALGPSSSGVYSASRVLFPFSLLQLWDVVRGQLASQHTCPKPLNCVAFHPEGQVIAVGGWAGSFSFFHVDGLRVTKVRGARCPCSGKHGRVEWKVGNGRHLHPGSPWVWVESRPCHSSFYLFV